MAGRIHQLNVSRGGVPKRAVPTATVTPAGLEGDQQRNLNVHGGPDRAVCLYALEQIQVLRNEGHPTVPGALGENITLEGVPWDQVVPGTRLALGPEVVVEVTSYTAPCKNIRGALKDHLYARVSQVHHPGASRVYARVLTPGVLKPGDPADIQR